jgi:glycosyltransferase involved in cell wall biosynthesis
MKNVLLKAPILSRSGYGEHARLVYRSLKRNTSLNVYVLPIDWGQSSWVMDLEKISPTLKEDLDKMASPPPQFDLSVQVTIPNEWQKMAPINIGVTAGIETDRVDPAWLQQANMMDKIIVISNHSKNVFEGTSYQVQDSNTGATHLLKCETPVEVIGYPVKELTPVDLSEKVNLSANFNFLTIAQWGPRKNLENSIKWFVEEFLHNEDVGLVIKTHQVNMSILDRRKLKRIVELVLAPYGNERKCKIHFIHGDMTPEEIHGLYTHPKVKAFSTITHGEGYGLPIFEAAYSGLPVIAPAWSGQNDFLYAPVKNEKSGKVKDTPLFEKVKFTIAPVQKEVVWEGVITQEAQWCYPDPDSYKKKLRDVYKGLNYRNVMANGLQAHVKENFSEDIICNKYLDVFNPYLDTSKDDEEIENMFASLSKEG